MGTTACAGLARSAVSTRTVIDAPSVAVVSRRPSEVIPMALSFNSACRLTQANARRVARPGLAHRALLHRWPDEPVRDGAASWRIQSGQWRRALGGGRRRSDDLHRVRPATAGRHRSPVAPSSVPSEGRYICLPIRGTNTGDKDGRVARRVHSRGSAAGRAGRGEPTAVRAPDGPGPAEDSPHPTRSADTAEESASKTTPTAPPGRHSESREIALAASSVDGLPFIVYATDLPRSLN